MNAKRELMMMMNGHPTLMVKTYSPGDGKVRYRIMKKSDEHDYFSDYGYFTGSARECVIFMYGYRRGKSIEVDTSDCCGCDCLQCTVYPDRLITVTEEE